MLKSLLSATIPAFLFVLILLVSRPTTTLAQAALPVPQNDNQDTDRDGLPDAWETQFGLNAKSASGPNGAMGDPDRDGLPNGDESANGTDPRKADTDGDGLPDLWEVENLTDPLVATGDAGPNGDPDGDGLINKDEMAHHGDPINWDTDGDSLPDGWEVGEGIKPNDNRGANGADGTPPGRKGSNHARFEKFNDDFVPPKPHQGHH